MWDNSWTIVKSECAHIGPKIMFQKHLTNQALSNRSFTGLPSNDSSWAVDGGVPPHAALRCSTSMWAVAFCVVSLFSMDRLIIADPGALLQMFP